MQGDILFLHMSQEPIRAGEIVVFNVDVGSYFCIYDLSFKLHVTKPTIGQILVFLKQLVLEV